MPTAAGRRVWCRQVVVGVMGVGPWVAAVSLQRWQTSQLNLVATAREAGCHTLIFILDCVVSPCMSSRLSWTIAGG
jgi:hypothetical protein